jgi:hypothetical protein
LKYNQHLRKRLTAEDEKRKYRILMKKLMAIVPQGLLK